MFALHVHCISFMCAFANQMLIFIPLWILYRLHILELLVGLYIFFCAVYDFNFGHNHFYLYLFLQAGAFFIIGFGYIGTFVPT